MLADFQICISVPLTTEIDNLTETIFLEVNVQSSQWLFVGCYKPPSLNEELFYQQSIKVYKCIFYKI